MAARQKPFHTLRNGGIKAAIWLNDGIKGPFFSTTFSRSFKDRTGAWRNAGPFNFRGLEVLMNLILPGYRTSRRLPGLLKFLTELIFISELGFKEKEQNYVRRGPSQNDRAIN